MDNVDSFASRLFSTTAKLARTIGGFSESSAASLDAEMHYVRTVYPDLKARLSSVLERLSGLGNGIAETQSASWQKTQNIREEYHPKIMDTLDLMFESMDDRLDSFYERKGKVRVAVREEVVLARKSRKVMQLEKDPLKIAHIGEQQIFVPEMHPFKRKIETLKHRQEDYMPPATVEPWLPLESTPLEWIDTVEALVRMAIDIEGEDLIAVDLENHSFHSYHGFVCLLQISTRKRDYLVDAILLRSEIGPALSPSFSNPQILKLFHGAQSDIQWLQRDFNLFVVNMFDTFFASKALQFPSHSLAYLMSHYVGIPVDKQYQLADWRTRPLPEAMVRYAQMDTHYLPYIYDRIRKDLEGKGQWEMILSVLQRSSLSALALYKGETFDPHGWRSIVEKSSVPYSARETGLVKALHYWREMVARREDQSPPAVLPNYMILRMAQGSSIADPEVLLLTSKHQLKAALKHIDSLKEALAGGGSTAAALEFLAKGIGTDLAKSHTKFPDSDVEPDAAPTPALKEKDATADSEAFAEISAPVMLAATELRVTFAPNPLQAKKSMAGLFAAPSAAPKALGAAKVVSGMSITKAARAATAVFEAKAEPEADSEACGDLNAECTQETPETQVSVLQSGEMMTQSAVLELATNAPEAKVSLFGGPLAKRPLPQDKDELDAAVDLASASKRLYTKPAESPDQAGAVFDPYVRPRGSTINAPAVNIGPRLGPTPRSGNRSLSFTPADQ